MRRREFITLIGGCGSVAACCARTTVRDAGHWVYQRSLLPKVMGRIWPPSSKGWTKTATSMVVT